MLDGRRYCFGGMKVGPTVRIGFFSSVAPVESAAAGAAGGGVAAVGTGGRCALLGRGRRRLALRLRALLHPLRAFLGDDDVALLFDRGLVVDRFQRLGPGLARGLAGAGRVELGAEFERVGQRGIVLAVERDRLVDVFAGVAVGEQGRLRRRAQRLAGPLVVLETRLHRGERDREIRAVAGADADGAERAGWRGRDRRWAAAADCCCCRTDCRGSCRARARRRRHIAGRNCSAPAPSAPSGAGFRGRRRRCRRCAGARGWW